MKLAVIIGLVTLTIAQVNAQSANREPTHLIKFKGKHVFKDGSAEKFFTARFREFSSSAVLQNHVVSSSFDTASLASIDFGDHFHVVSGVFHDTFAQFLHNQSDIDYVEANQLFKANRALPPPKEHRMNRRALVDYPSPSWGIARVYHHENTDLTDYVADDESGAGVTAYVLDSGININHEDFEGRASYGANFVTSEDDDDYAGHGTHVAGTIGGLEFGVAKKVLLKSVKILDKHGDGSTTGLLKALSWVSANSTPGKSIINLSLSGPKSKLVEQAIEQTSRDRNIPMIVSAGNTGDDACKYLPAASSYAFAVGATDSTDTIAYYSAIGKCVRMYAPGTNILSAWSTSDTATMVLDGTSMANPHVSGIASILLAQKSYSNVQELYGDLVATGTKNILTPSNMQSQNNLTVDNVLAFAPAAR